jgi:hypothetical protein
MSFQQKICKHCGFPCLFRVLFYFVYLITPKIIILITSIYAIFPVPLLRTFSPAPTPYRHLRYSVTVTDQVHTRIQPVIKFEVQ